MAAVGTLTQSEKFSKVTTELMDLIGGIIERLYNEGLSEINPQIIKAVSGFLSMFDSKIILETFIKYSTKPLAESINGGINSGINCWDQIYNRDELFFLENCQ